MKALGLVFYRVVGLVGAGATCSMGCRAGCQSPTKLIKKMGNLYLLVNAYENKNKSKFLHIEIACFSDKLWQKNVRQNCLTYKRMHIFLLNKIFASLEK